MGSGVTPSRCNLRGGAAQVVLEGVAAPNRSAGFAGLPSNSLNYKNSIQQAGPRSQRFSYEGSRSQEQGVPTGGRPHRFPIPSHRSRPQLYDGSSSLLVPSRAAAERIPLVRTSLASTRPDAPCLLPSSPSPSRACLLYNLRKYYAPFIWTCQASRSNNYWARWGQGKSNQHPRFQVSGCTEEYEWKLHIYLLGKIENWIGMGPLRTPLASPRGNPPPCND